MTHLENPWLIHLDRDLDAMFLDTTLWDIRDNWELFAYTYERGLIPDIVEPELTTEDPADPIEAFEAMPDDKAASLIERWIERHCMISDYISWKEEWNND